MDNELQKKICGIVNQFLEDAIFDVNAADTHPEIVAAMINAMAIVYAAEKKK